MPASRRNKPLSVRVTRDGVLTIEIGIDALAHATLQKQVNDRMPGRLSADCSITQARGFALEVKAALLEEEEDGSSLLTDMLDSAAQKAIEDGSLYFEDKED